MAAASVYIFGASRSGTTLLLSLCRAYEQATVLPWESPIDELEDSSRQMIAKRTRVSALTLADDVERLSHIRVVNLVRDPREVVTSRFIGSREFHTDFDRWHRDHEVARILQRRLPDRCVTVGYDELIRNPDGCQRRISAFTGLIANRRFSEFPWGDTFCDGREVRAMGGARSIAPRSSRRWLSDPSLKGRLLNQVLQYPELVERVRSEGFDTSDDWLADL